MGIGADVIRFWVVIMLLAGVMSDLTSFRYDVRARGKNFLL